MDEIKLAMLGNRDAQEKLTRKGIMIPCQCGGEAAIRVEKVPDEKYEWYHAEIICKACLMKISRMEPGEAWAKERVIKDWNRRAPLLSAEELETINGKL